MCALPDATGLLQTEKKGKRGMDFNTGNGSIEEWDSDVYLSKGVRLEAETQENTGRRSAGEEERSGLLFQVLFKGQRGGSTTYRSGFAALALVGMLAATVSAFASVYAYDYLLRDGRITSQCRN